VAEQVWFMTRIQEEEEEGQWLVNQVKGQSHPSDTAH